MNSSMSRVHRFQHDYLFFFFFFFNDTATTEIYTLSLHDALPIYLYRNWVIDAFERDMPYDQFIREQLAGDLLAKDRKSTRLNSSHVEISYAVFCLKKKKKIKIITNTKSIIPTTTNYSIPPLIHLT